MSRIEFGPPPLCKYCAYYHGPAYSGHCEVIGQRTPGDIPGCESFNYKE